MLNYNGRSMVSDNVTLLKLL